MNVAAHDERHALLEELELLRRRRRELEESLVSDDHRPHDFGDQGETTELRDEIDWLDRRIRDLAHYLWEAGRPDGDASERVGLYSVVTVRFPDGSCETVQVSCFPDEDVPVVTPESPLGRALFGAQPAKRSPGRRQKGVCMPVSSGSAVRCSCPPDDRRCAWSRRLVARAQDHRVDRTGTSAASDRPRRVTAFPEVGPAGPVQRSDRAEMVRRGVLGRRALA